MLMLRSLCVFAGARIGQHSAYMTAARTLGSELAHRDIGLIYGGGRTGIMGMIAETVVSQGGHVIGVIPTGLWSPDEDHPGLPQCIQVASLGERKTRMLELADACLVLPGGYGTLNELTEVLTLGQLDAFEKPVGLLDCAGFFTAWLRLQRHLIQSEFASKPQRQVIAASVSKVLDALIEQCAGVPRQKETLSV